MNSYRLKAALAASVAAATLIPTASFAQTSDEGASDGGFDVIIVTARKADENLQKTPVAVTAISAEGIQTQQLATAVDVQRAAPGLLARGAGTGPTAIVTYALRGNAQNSPNSVSESAVGIYLDGVYLARPISSNLGFLDVANIQVVRGTQGTLFGRNTTGGAVQFTTTQPDGDFAGYVKAEVGNYDHRLVEGAVTLPIAGEELSARFAARYTERDGYGENQFTGAPLGDIESDVSTRATIKWAPASMPVTLTVSGEYLKSNDNGVVHALGAVNPAGPLANFFPGQFSTDFIQTPNNFYDSFGGTVTPSENVNTPRNYNEAFGFTGTLEVDLGGIEVKSITAYRDSDSGNTLDLDGTPAGGVEFDSQYRQHQFSQELTLAGEMGSLEWIVGGYYFKESGDERSDSYALHDVPALGGISLTPSRRTFSDFKGRSAAVFGQVNYNFTDALRVTGGLRYTWDKRNIVGRGINNLRTVPEITPGGVVQPGTCGVGPNAGTLPPTPCENPFSASFSYPAWTFGVDYQVNPDLLVYAKTGGASLSGGFNTRPVPLGAEAFEPEDVRDIEAGFKGEFLNNRLQTNLAGFYVWRNSSQSIVNTLVNGALTQYVENSGSIRSYGAELEVRALPWEGMEIRSAVSRLWSKYKAGSFVNDGLLGPVDRSDEDVAQTPEWTFNIGATQTVEADWGKMSFHLDYAYISSRNFGQDTADVTGIDPQGPEPVRPRTPAEIADIIAFTDLTNQLGTLDGYGILNGRVAIEFDDPGLELAIWGRNMLGKRYSQNLFNNYGGIGFVSYNPGPPATFGATATVRW